MDEKRCIEEVPGEGRFGYFHMHQCSRKRGYGPNGQFCKQHDPDRKQAEYDQKRKKQAVEYAKEKARFDRIAAAFALVEGIPTNEIKNYQLVKIANSQ